MKLKNLRDAVNNRLKDLDGDCEVKFIHDAKRKAVNELTLVCRKLSGLLYQDNTVYLIPEEVGDVIKMLA